MCHFRRIAFLEDMQMIEPRFSDCAPIGATECYGFSVGIEHWHLSKEEKAERERKYREEHCTDKPTRGYYLDKYARIFTIFYKAAEFGIYECSNEEWQKLWEIRERYRKRAAYHATQKEYVPAHQRQDINVMWEKLYELKRELAH